MLTKSGLKRKTKVIYMHK